VKIEALVFFSQIRRNNQRIGMMMRIVPSKPYGLQGTNFTAGRGFAWAGGRRLRLGIAGFARAQTFSNPSQQPKDQNDEKDSSQQPVRSVPKSITACREGSDQQQYDNDKKN